MPAVPVGHRLLVLQKFRRSRLFKATLIDWLLTVILLGWGRERVYVLTVVILGSGRLGYCNASPTLI